MLNFIRTILNLLFPVAAFAYASRILGVEGVGIVNYTDSIVKYLLLIGGGGILFYGIREVAKVRENQEQLEKLVVELLVINLLLTGVACLFLFFLLRSSLGKQFTVLILIQGSLVLFNAIGMEWLYQAKEEFVYITVRTLFFQTMSFIALLIFVRTKEDYLVYALIMVFAVAGTQLINFICARQYLGVLKKGIKLELREHFQLMKYIFGANLSISIYLHADQTMLGVMAGTSVVGLYAGANNITRAAAGLLTCLTNVVFPRISFYFENGKSKEAFQLIEDAGNIILMAVVPASIGLACISEPVMVLVCGKEFASAYPALIVLAINVIFSVYNNYWVWQIFLPLNREKLVFIGTTCSAAINIGLNFIWIPQYGLIGAAMATLVAEMILSGLCILWGKKALEGRHILTGIWQYFLGGFAVCLICFVVEYGMGHTLVALSVKIVASMVSYVLLLYLMKNQYLFKLIDIVWNLAVRRK